MAEGIREARFLEVIRLASSKLAERRDSQPAHHSVTTGLRIRAQQSPEIIAPLIEHLLAIPELKKMSSSWMYGFSRRSQLQMNSTLIAAHLASRSTGIPAESALQELIDLARSNSATARLTALVAGVRVDEPLALADGLQILPFRYDQLPAGVTSVRSRFPGGVVDKITPEPSGCRVWDFPYSPVFETASVNPDPFPEDKVDRLTSVANQLSVVSDHEVAVLEMWITANDDRLPGDLGWVTFRHPSWGSGPVFEAVHLDHEGAIEFLKQCDRFDRGKEWDTLELAMSRFNTSRRSVGAEDRAIDLGTVLEILLMHRGSENTEMTFKLSTRGAWALEETFGGRTQVFEQIRDLYAKRSQAVHQGRLKAGGDPLEEFQTLEAGSLLVARLIREIVARGGFPDWKTLVLGGGWKPAS